MSLLILVEEKKTNVILSCNCFQNYMLLSTNTYLEDKGSVALPTLTQYQSVSTFESEVRNLLSALEPSSTGSQ